MANQRKPDLKKDNYTELERRVDQLLATERTIRDRKAQAAAESGMTLPEDTIDDIHVIDNSKQPDKNIDELIAESVKQTEDEIEAHSTDSTTNPEPEDTLADKQTDKAVKDIITHEGDTVLASEDRASQSTATEKPNLVRRIGGAIRSWWQNPVQRNTTIGGVVVILLVVGIIPTSRYFVLNALGVRSSMSIQIVDNSSLQPLRNVEVRIGEATGYTDDTGSAHLSELKLGNHDVHISRRAFANRTVGVTLGWGSNPLGEYWLYPTGSQYIFVLEDFLSGAPIMEGEVRSDDADALANEEGVARLTIDAEDDAPEIEVEIRANGYRTDTITIHADTIEQQTVQLVPYIRHYFVSERDDQFDVYAIDADGENEQLVLEGTGAEREDMTLLAHPERNRVAVISTRENQRNEDGFLLNDLTIVDETDERIETIASSERIQLVDWYGDYLVFLQITAGASGTNPERHRIVRYNYQTERTVTLAASNYFNSIMPIGPYVYFAPSSIFQDTATELERIHVENDEREVAFSSESWSLYRSGLEELIVATSNRWYSLRIDDGTSERLDEAPVNPSSRLYRQNPWDESVFARAEQRDGQGLLLLEDAGVNGESIIHESPGVGYPLRWIHEKALVYRVETIGEVADYVISTDNGATQKIQNVTSSKSLERWYAY